MIYNIIQSVTEKLSSLPFIEGIVLGGSRARGSVRAAGTKCRMKREMGHQMSCDILNT